MKKLIVSFTLVSIVVFAISKSEEAVLRAQLMKAQTDLVAAAKLRDDTLRKLSRLQDKTTQQATIQNSKDKTADSQRTAIGTDITMNAEDAKVAVASAALISAQIQLQVAELISISSKNNALIYITMGTTGLGFLSLLVTVYREGRAHRWAINETLTQLKAVKVVTDTVSAEATSTRTAVDLLEKNTNSMKDALVKITGESEFARGQKVAEDLHTRKPRRRQTQARRLTKS